MRIQVITSGRRTNDSPARSVIRSLNTNNLLSVFPRGISLSNINSDHIYSSLHTDNTHRIIDSECESSESDVDSLADSFDEVENDTPVKPKVITQHVKRLGNPPLIKSKECLEIVPGKFQVLDHDEEKHERPHTDPPNNCKTTRNIVEFNTHEDDPEQALSNAGYLANDNDNDMLSLNADSIQKVFQNTIYMTSFMPISEGASRPDKPLTQKTPSGEEIQNTPEREQHICDANVIRSNTRSEFQPFKIYDKCLDRKGQKCVKLRSESSIIPDKTSTPKTKACNETDKTIKPINDIEEELQNGPAPKTYKNAPIKKSNKGCQYRQRNIHEKNNDQKSVHSRMQINGGITKTADEIDTPTKSMCQTVNDKEYREISRDLENDRELCIKINYTLGLLVKKWGEYLTMTADQIRDMEIQNAKEMNMVEEVIEMLEDNDRYVWELIDELKFF